MHLSLGVYRLLLLVRRHLHSKLKTTIDCNNILIKVQFINIVAVSDSETHSERFACIKGTINVFSLFSEIASINIW